MKKYLLAAVAVTAISTPAYARDGQAYVGIEGGVLFAPDHDADVFVDYATTQTPVAPVITTPAPLDFEANNALNLDYKTGLDLDAVVGYDFGMFRVEGEIGWKKAKLKELDVDDSFIAGLNTALNRPATLLPLPADPVVPGLPALVSDDFDLNGKTTVFSLMLNGLLDFGDEDGLSFYAGLGLGWAKVKVSNDFVDQSDGAWAGQLIAGVRYAITPNIDLGLKYRFFRTAKVHLADDDVALLNGNPNRFDVGLTAPLLVDRTTNALLSTDFDNRF